MVMVERDARSEKEKQHDAKMAAAKAMLLGGRGPKTTTRQVIGKPSRGRSKTGNVYATGYHSDALGVSPGQIPEATAALRAHGVMNDFDPKTGACIITSPNDHRKVARATGLNTGRDGFDVKDSEGRSDLTGKRKVMARREAKADLMKRIEDCNF